MGFHEDEALLTYVLALEAADGGSPLADIATDLRGEIAVLTRTWSEQVIAGAATSGVVDAVAPWVSRLPVTYRAGVAPHAPVRDCRELAALAAGDTLLLPHQLYGTTHQLVESQLRPRGVEVVHLDVTDLAAVRRYLDAARAPST